MDAELEAQEKKRFDLAQEILDKNPSIGFISALIIAGDKLSAQRADEMLEKGSSFDAALVFVGSYARLEWALQAFKDKKVSYDHLLDILPELWRGSDPDDTNLEFRELWQDAFTRNNNKTVCDSEPLPKGILNIYRGQDDDGSIGIAWTLNEKIAQKFANGAALRQYNRKGIVYRARVKSKKVLGYLKLRNEEEVIVNPFDLE